ncbi:replication initiation factor domain-containing protein [Enterococcus sp. 22-H-5-01]|uniref:replication initiation factor domain-containing protein n=1 Tax=Enterococcus sp. 22-H-5-01 TaxID=3418555 RepID=UPI003D07B0FE
MITKQLQIGHTTLSTTSNTVLTREPDREKTLLIDYLSVSFIDAAVADVANYLFPNLDLLVQKSFANGFATVLTNGKIFLHYGSDNDVVLLVIQSKGCRFLESLPLYTWQTFLQKLFDIDKYIEIDHFNFKRFDIAVDSFVKDTLTPNRVRRSFSSGLITSRFHTIRLIEEATISSKTSKGDSIYFGSRSSDLYLVIYNKALESRIQGEWFRTEIRCKNEQANRLIVTLLDEPEDFSTCVADLLQNRIQFRSSVHRKSEIRRSIFAVWYSRYLKYLRQQSLYSGTTATVQGGDLDD